MNTFPSTPRAWANFLVRAWGPVFPICPRQISLEYSRTFPDPILTVTEAEIESFEGALYPLKKKGGWAVLFNPKITSRGRVRFTLAHELGHYLVHRSQRPQGFECGQSQIVGYDPESERRKMEEEADQFASYLLMPINDFKLQTEGVNFSLDLLRHCGDRYGVSFTAATLKWLEFTARCAVVIVATDGFVLWCRRSDLARKKRMFFPKGMPLPDGSAAAHLDSGSGASEVGFGPGIWSPHDAGIEFGIYADRYDLSITLLIFEEEAQARWLEAEEQTDDDVLDRMMRVIEGR